MIGKLKGIVEACYVDHAIIDVNGVGYLVFCSHKTLANLNLGNTAILLIETHVREDHIHLYGFYNSEEKNSFTLLQSVKGVGTKMALAILSTLTPEEISHALVTKDILAFNKAPGVGKKLAERIITELKDKYLPAYSSVIPASRQTAGNENAYPNNIAIDAISALTTLGVNKTDAQNRISALLAQDKNLSLNELIKYALKNGIPG